MTEDNKQRWTVGFVMLEPIRGEGNLEAYNSF